VERLISLGAALIDIGQGDVDWMVMADPDGNEFLCAASPTIAFPGAWQVAWKKRGGGSRG